MTISQSRTIETWPILSIGFRPFFLAAGVWGCLSMTLWILMLRGHLELPTAFAPSVWHFHELLFGFAASAIAGFLLTAIPNWTGRPPLQGWSLGFLIILWIVGRIAVAFSAMIGAPLAMAADLAFLIVFAGVVGREIVVSHNWRNLPVLGAIAFLILSNTMIHLGTLDRAVWEPAGKRLGISVIILLISLIGGRIIPSFTTNWLRRQNVVALPTLFNRFDKATLAITIIALGAWTITGLNPVSGVALIFAAIAHAIRLGRWRGGATLSEPLVWILHLGYAWLPVGLLLLGAAAWIPGLGTTGIHALTVGGMGTMIIAVMTRASLGHSNRELTAGYGTLAIYALVFLAGVARVLAPFLETGYAEALELAGGAWLVAFALFVVLYLPLYIRR